MTQLRFALAQIDTCVGALDANAAKVLDYSRKAAAGNAQVVVFPEMTLTGYPIEDLALRRTFRQAAWDKANELATQLNDDGLGDLFVVVGTVGTDRKTSKPRNRLVVLHQGVVWAGYDKHFLPNYGVFDEFRIFSAGDRSVTLDVDGATIGVAICEDIWQDGGPVAELAKENIDLWASADNFQHDSLDDFFGIVADRVGKGARVRLLFGDPESKAVVIRSFGKGLGDHDEGR